MEQCHLQQLSLVFQHVPPARCTPASSELMKSDHISQTALAQSVLDELVVHPHRVPLGLAINILLTLCIERRELCSRSGNKIGDLPFCALECCAVNRR